MDSLPTPEEWHQAQEELARLSNPSMTQGQKTRTSDNRSYNYATENKKCQI